MRRGALSVFSGVFTLLILLFVSNPSTFFSNESMPILGTVALASGFLSIPEGMIDGFSFDRSVQRLMLMSVLLLGLIGGGLWLMMHHSARLFVIP